VKGGEIIVKRRRDVARLPLQADVEKQPPNSVARRRVRPNVDILTVGKPDLDGLTPHRQRGRAPDHLLLRLARITSHVSMKLRHQIAVTTRQSRPSVQSLDKQPRTVGDSTASSGRTFGNGGTVSLHSKPSFNDFHCPDTQELPHDKFVCQNIQQKANYIR
jgi:hypothetical protein